MKGTQRHIALVRSNRRRIRTLPAPMPSAHSYLRDIPVDIDTEPLRDRLNIPTLLS